MFKDPRSSSKSASLEAQRDADETLAEALLAGSPGAAEEAWSRLLPLVRRVVGRYFGACDERQDLCQEIFLRFFSRITELRDRRALRSFIVGISLGVVQNERRRAYVRSAIHLAPGDDLPDYPLAPADSDAREAMGRFFETLALVAAEDRALFVVRHVEKAPLTHIAAVSGWSLAKTKRRIARVNRRVGLKMRRDPALAEYASAFPI